MKAKVMAVIASLMALLLLSGMASAGERMMVSTEKDAYALGESVTIEVVNLGNERAKLGGYWVEDADENVVYLPETLAFEEYLEPGESRRYVWTQIDDFGVQVPAGIYTICIEESSARTEILPEPLVLSTDKAVYEPGECVTFALTNEGSTEVSVSRGYSVLDEKGNLVYAPDVLCYEVVLQPGESFQYVWEQVDDNGNIVPDGTYIICATNSQVSVKIVSETADGPAEIPNGNQGRPARQDFIPKLPTPVPKSLKPI